MILFLVVCPPPTSYEPHVCSFQKSSTTCVSFPLFYAFTFSVTPLDAVNSLHETVRKTIVVERVATSSHHHAPVFTETEKEEDKEVGLGGGGDAVVFISRDDEVTFKFETQILRVGRKALDHAKRFFPSVTNTFNLSDTSNDDPDVFVCMGEYSLEINAVKL